MLPETDKPKTTNIQTLMHILKGNLGPAVLAIPYAFINSGLLVGAICVPLLGIICVHCMQIMVNSYERISKRMTINYCDYESVFECAVQLGPQIFRRHARKARYLTILFLAITQLGICSVYFVFIPENIKLVISNVTHQQVTWSIYTYQLLMLPIVLGLVSIRHLRTLAWGSSIANIGVFIGFVIIFYGIFQDFPSAAERKLTAKISQFPVFLGTTIYAFEGIGLVLPIWQVMKKPKAYQGNFGVLNLGMTVIVLIFTATGICGYIKYGDDVKGSITLNLPSDAIYQVCRMLFAIAVFFSYPVQFYVPIHIICPLVIDKVNSKSSWINFAIEFSLRYSLVFLTYICAYAIPNLGLYISLLGALTSTSLALLFPPLIDMCVLWQDDSIRNNLPASLFMYSKNIFIFVLGLFSFFVGTYASIVDILNSERQ